MGFRHPGSIWLNLIWHTYVSLLCRFSLPILAVTIDSMTGNTEIRLRGKNNFHSVSWCDILISKRYLMLTLLLLLHSTLFEIVHKNGHFVASVYWRMIRNKNIRSWYTLILCLLINKSNSSMLYRPRPVTRGSRVRIPAETILIFNIALNESFCLRKLSIV